MLSQKALSCDRCRFMLRPVRKQHPLFLMATAQIILLVLAYGEFASAKAQSPYVFENLGAPMRPLAVPIQAATVNRGGQVVAWGVLADPDRFGVVGVDARTGEHFMIDLMEKYKRSNHIRIARGVNGHLYIYATSPARFFKYDIDQHQLIPLKKPTALGRYLSSRAIAPDGRFYVGSYPLTKLDSVNTSTDEVYTVARLSEDKREKYIISLSISDENIVYAAVGLHHAELWAYDPTTDVKRQILPKELSRHQGVVNIFVADDGHVYGTGYGKSFRCYPDRIEYLSQLPEPRNDRSQGTLDGVEYREVDPEGRLVIYDTRNRSTRTVQTSLRGADVMIYSIGGIYEGKVWGGGMGPARTWTFDLQTHQMEDWGRLVRPLTQIYDTFFHSRGLFLSSYLGADIDLLDPQTRELKHIVSLKSTNGQERLPHFVLGQDGQIYGPTMPVKGHLDGGVVRVDPDTLDYQWFPIIDNMAPTSLVVVPNTNMIFGTATLESSTSAISPLDEAAVFLWDVKKQKVVWQGSPLPGTKHYRWATLGRNGVVYGITNTQYFAFDPVRRKTLKTGNLPVPSNNLTSLLAPEPTGPDGLIVGLLRGRVFAIDPADHSVRVLAEHESILRDEHVQKHTTLSIWASPEGMLYYGSGHELWRVDLNVTK